MQASWGQTSSGSPSPFHNSQSPGLKPSRPPPPYPHPKQEKPPPTSESAAAPCSFKLWKLMSSYLLLWKKKRDCFLPAVLKQHKLCTRKRDVWPQEMQVRSAEITQGHYTFTTTRGLRSFLKSHWIVFKSQSSDDPWWECSIVENPTTL